MRPEQRAACRPVARPGGPESLPQKALDRLSRLACPGAPLGLTGQTQIGLGEGPSRAGVDGVLQRRQRRHPGPGHARACLGEPGLQRVQPQRVGFTPLRRLQQQAQPLAQGLVIGRDRCRMVGHGGKHQPVKEAQPVGPRIGKQPVLLRRGPDGPEILEQPSGLGRLAIDAHDPPRRACPRHAGAQPRVVVQLDRHRPGPARGLARFAPPHLGRRRPAQPLAGRQQAQRFQQIGLARPVRPMQHHRPRPRLQPRGPVRTEISEGEGGDQGFDEGLVRRGGLKGVRPHP